MRSRASRSIHSTDLRATLPSVASVRHSQSSLSSLRPHLREMLEYLPGLSVSDLLRLRLPSVAPAGQGREQRPLAAALREAEQDAAHEAKQRALPGAVRAEEDREPIAQVAHLVVVEDAVAVDV